jgi:hypothetical protein
MHNLPAWVMDDPHALTQLLGEGGFALNDEYTSPCSFIASREAL